jgi:hypothetical protein
MVFGIYWLELFDFKKPENFLKGSQSRDFEYIGILNVRDFERSGF